MKLAECIAVKFYNTYPNLFQDMSMDIADAKQEGYLCVVELMKNKKFSGITLPLVKQAVSWKFKQMLGNQKENMHGIKVSSLEELITSESDDCSAEELTTDDTHPKSYLTNARIFFSKSFPEAEIKKLITERQYEVLVYKIQNNLTFKEIGEKIGKTRQNAEWLYRNALNRLRLHYK